MSIRDLIEEQEDVKRVVALGGCGPNRYRYVIETPFLTFPRFVVGTTNSTLTEVSIEFSCGKEENALNEFFAKQESEIP